MQFLFLFLLLSGFLFPACAAPRGVPDSLHARLRSADIELVESAPVETTLDHADLRDAKDVWIELMNSARRSIDLAEFYVSSEQKSALEPVLHALLSARACGVTVRLLVDAKMSATYPADLERLRSGGILIRRIELRPVTGGVMHAKYFIVDGETAYVGSRNFDWRALEHIHELGVRIHNVALAQELESVFAADWARAQGEGAPPIASASAVSSQSSAAPGVAARLRDGDGDPVRVELLVSPGRSSPLGMPIGKAASISGSAAGSDEGAWELPRLVELIDQARRSVRIELFLYRGPQGDVPGGPMEQLEAALRRAAGRGVRVELLVQAPLQGPGSAAKSAAQPGLLGLLFIPGVAVKTVTIPLSRRGEIPFARLIHAKYMVVDGEAAWIGSSNWEDRYFLQSRNVAVLLAGPRLCSRLDRFFLDLWNSPYAEPLRAPQPR